MRDYVKDFQDKLDDESFSDYELICIAKDFISELQKERDSHNNVLKYTDNIVIVAINDKWLIQIDKKESLVGFLDRRYMNDSSWKYGQPVTCYYIDTILEHEKGCGLALDGGILDWSLTAEEVELVKAEIEKYR